MLNPGLRARAADATLWCFAGGRRSWLHCWLQTCAHQTNPKHRNPFTRQRRDAFALEPAVDFVRRRRRIAGNFQRSRLERNRAAAARKFRRRRGPPRFKHSAQPAVSLPRRARHLLDRRAERQIPCIGPAPLPQLVQLMFCRAGIHKRQCTGWRGRGHSRAGNETMVLLPIAGIRARI